jgi:hypothetical protein
MIPPCRQPEARGSTETGLIPWRRCRRLPGAGQRLPILGAFSRGNPAIPGVSADSTTRADVSSARLRPRPPKHWSTLLCIRGRAGPLHLFGRCPRPVRGQADRLRPGAGAAAADLGPRQDDGRGPRGPEGTVGQDDRERKAISSHRLVSVVAIGMGIHRLSPAKPGLVLSLCGDRGWATAPHLPLAARSRRLLLSSLRIPALPEVFYNV